MTPLDKPVILEMVEGGIIVFRFKKAERTAADHFTKLINLTSGMLPDPLRLMQDFSECDLPTPYFLRTMTRIYTEVVLPEDTLMAYVLREGSEGWAHRLNIIQHYTTSTDREKTFFSEEAAVNWLLTHNQRNT